MTLDSIESSTLAVRAVEFCLSSNVCAPIRHASARACIACIATLSALVSISDR